MRHETEFRRRERSQTEFETEAITAWGAHAPRVLAMVPSPSRTFSGVVSARRRNQHARARALPRRSGSVTLSHRFGEGDVAGPWESRKGKVESRSGQLISLADGFRKRDIAGLQVQLGFGGSAEDFGAVVVEFAFPSRDYNCGQAVADQVYASAAHVHELVDAENDGDTDGAEAGGEKAVQGS